MDAMKGEARAILYIDTADGRLQLVAYADESWGITRRGRIICMWESDELSDCLRTFLDMAGRRRDAISDAVMGIPSCAPGTGGRMWAFHTGPQN